jgi:hypothetical protein
MAFAWKVNLLFQNQLTLNQADMNIKRIVAGLPAAFSKNRNGKNCCCCW